MSANLLTEAKRRLPLPALMAQLGHGNRARKSARCPFHEDSSASFSVFQGTHGGWRWKCHGACAASGDEPDYLARARGLSPAEACREFIRLSGNPQRTSAPPFRPRPQPAVRQPELHPGTVDELAALTALRRLSLEGLQLACRRGLVRFGGHRGHRAWFVTDPSGRCTQARRMDGRCWVNEAKALTLPGSRASWPIGTDAAADYPVVLWCEGGPDLLSAHHFIELESRQTDACAVAMLGASLAIAAEALPSFAGHRVRFFTHADAPGQAGVRRWAQQLVVVGARVDAVDLTGLRKADGSAVKDLNDLTSIDADEFELHRQLWNLVPSL